jgi:hypothetical protein
MSRRGRDSMFDLQKHVESVSITTKVLSSNTAQGEVYLIQLYVINLSVTCDRSMVFARYAGYLHQ